MGTAATRTRLTSTRDISSGGEYLRDYRLAPREVPTGLSFGSGGKIACSSIGLPREGALVAVVDGLDVEARFVGDLVSEEIDIPPTLVQQMHERRLPAFMRNSALPVLAADGCLWVFLQAEAVLQRYGPGGSLLTHTELSVPEAELIEEEFFDWYAEVNPGDDVLRFLTLVENAVVVDDSVWLLWNMPRDQPALITVHEQGGDLLARLRFPAPRVDDPSLREGTPRRRFAVDRERSRLYLLDQNALSLSAYSFPAEVLSP